jgi:hypothetical protein
MKPTRAISIRQPWVELILRGEKKKEFRSQPTRIRGEVFLYASAKPADWAPGWRRAGCAPGDLPTGTIVGTVEIVDCRWDQRGDCYAYLLKHPRRLKRARKALNQPAPRFWIPRFR